MKKKIERMEINGIPVSISTMDRGDVENDTCWVTFDLYNTKCKGTICEFIRTIEQAAKAEAKKRGFMFLTSSELILNSVFRYRCTFSKVNLEEYYND